MPTSIRMPATQVRIAAKTAISAIDKAIALNREKRINAQWSNYLNSFNWWDRLLRRTPKETSSINERERLLQEDYDVQRRSLGGYPSTRRLLDDLEKFLDYTIKRLKILNLLYIAEIALEEGDEFVLLSSEDCVMIFGSGREKRDE